MLKKKEEKKEGSIKRTSSKKLFNLVGN